MKTDTLIESLSSDAKPIEKLKHPMLRCLFFVFLSMGFVVGSVYFIGIRHDMERVIGSEMFVLELLSALTTGLLAALAAHWLAIPDMRQQKWIIWLPFIPLSLFVFMAAYQFILQPVHIAESGNGVACVIDAIWLISLPVLLIFFLLHKAATTHARLASFMAIVAVLAFGYLCTRLVCPNDHLGHLLLWHYLPIVVVGIVGAFLGNRILRW